MNLPYFFKKILVSIFFVLPLTTVSAQTHHDWSYDKVVYEVNIRQYTQEGTFEAFESHLDRLQELGVGILWLMPIHPIGEENRLGSLGSYYSVKDYYGINPEFGDSTSFAHLVNEIHDRGMYVLMDWVANHTSWDNVLTETNPDWYIKNNQGNFTPPPGTNWSDVIQLDHSNPELNAYMIEAQKYWVQTFGIDGFRYDAVDWVPHSFWRASNDSLKALRSDLLLLAEGNGVEWHRSGFDMTFGWDFYGFENGLLVDIVEEKSNAVSIATYFELQIRNYPADGYRLYFTSNHDENSWSGTPAELFGNAAPTFAVLTSTVHGVPLIYSGQEAGLNKRLAFFDKDFIPWREHEYFSLYQTLITLKKENPALYNGSKGGLFERVDSNNPQGILSFIRKKDNNTVFGMINVRDTEQTTTLRGTQFHGSYEEVFSNQRSTFDGDTTIILSPWEYRIYSNYGISVSNETSFTPTTIKLHQNYPNPFNPSTVITFEIPRTMNVSIEILNLSGQIVEHLSERTYSQGKHQVVWNAANYASGLYFVHLRTQEKRVTKKILYIK